MPSIRRKTRTAPALKGGRHRRVTKSRVAFTLLTVLGSAAVVAVRRAGGVRQATDKAVPANVRAKAASVGNTVATKATSLVSRKGNDTLTTPATPETPVVTPPASAPVASVARPDFKA